VILTGDLYQLLALWCLQKMQEYWWYVEAFCKYQSIKELAHLICMCVPSRRQVRQNRSVWVEDD